MKRLTITVREVSVLLGISDDAIYDAIQAGTCTLRHQRAGRRIVFPIPLLCADLGITPATLVSLGLIPADVAALFAAPPAATVAEPQEAA